MGWVSTCQSSSWVSTGILYPLTAWAAGKQVSREDLGWWMLESKAQICFLPHWLPVGDSFNFYLRRGEGKNESWVGGEFCREYLLLCLICRHLMT